MRAHKEAIIIGIISVLFLGGMAFLIWHTPTAIQPAAVTLTPAQQALLVHPDNHMTGTYGAKVTMVEFGDYQCPACGEAYPLVKQVTDMYASNPNFNFVFRNFPLPQHPNAPEAAEAAEAASAQGKYWQMHDALYTGQNDWANLADPTSTFVQYATTLGLNVTQFTSDVSGKKYESVIAADQADGNALGVDATPTIYINGTQVTSFDPASMEATINTDLAAQ